MNRIHISLLFTALIFFAAEAQTLKLPDTVEVRQWREDIALLRKEMPQIHANLFHTMTREQFDSSLNSIEKHLPRFARHQVIVELMKLSALVGDGHTRVSPWRDTAIAFHQLPIALYSFKEGMIVRAAAKSHSELLGAKVVGIGSASIEEAIARVRPLIGRDNEMGTLAWAPVFLTMAEILHAVGLSKDPLQAEFTFEVKGNRKKVMLASSGLFPMMYGETDITWLKRDGWNDARDHVPEPLWLEELTDIYRFTFLHGSKTLYCRIYAIQQKEGDSLAAFMKRAIHTADSAGAVRFVLDVRLNGGGNGYWNRDIIRSVVKSNYDQPGKLFVITGRRTFSAAQMLICAMEEYTDAVFAGEPSSSRGIHYGDSKKIVMPNSGVVMRVSSLYWQLTDPRDTRPWIPVSIPASLSFEDYVQGRDPVLKAIEKINAEK